MTCSAGQSSDSVQRDARALWVDWSRPPCSGTVVPGLRPPFRTSSSFSALETQVPADCAACPQHGPRSRLRNVPRLPFLRQRKSRSYTVQDSTASELVQLYEYLYYVVVHGQL